MCTCVAWCLCFCERQSVEEVLKMLWPRWCDVLYVNRSALCEQSHSLNLFAFTFSLACAAALLGGYAAYVAPSAVLFCVVPTKHEQVVRWACSWRSSLRCHYTRHSAQGAQCPVRAYPDAMRTLPHRTPGKLADSRTNCASGKLTSLAMQVCIVVMPFAAACRCCLATWRRACQAPAAGPARLPRPRAAAKRRRHARGGGTLSKRP